MNMLKEGMTCWCRVCCRQIRKHLTKYGCLLVCVQKAEERKKAHLICLLFFKWKIRELHNTNRASFVEKRPICPLSLIKNPCCIQITFLSLSLCPLQTVVACIRTIMGCGFVSKTLLKLYKLTKDPRDHLPVRMAKITCFAFSVHGRKGLKCTNGTVMWTIILLNTLLGQWYVHF